MSRFEGCVSVSHLVSPHFMASRVWHLTKRDPLQYPHIIGLAFNVTVPTPISGVLNSVLEQSYDPWFKTVMKIRKLT